MWYKMKQYQLKCAFSCLDSLLGIIDVRHDSTAQASLPYSVILGSITLPYKASNWARLRRCDLLNLISLALRQKFQILYTLFPVVLFLLFYFYSTFRTSYSYEEKITVRYEKLSPFHCNNREMSFYQSHPDRSPTSWFYLVHYKKISTAKSVK